MSVAAAKAPPAGFEIAHRFRPGDLGRLIEIHGLQNRSDYGFDEKHEAYCAQIAAAFVLDREPRRSRVWLALRGGVVVGSVFICEREGNAAQLRLLFVDHAVRGHGLGRWLVEAAVDYCRDAGFARLYLWTVAGLDRALGIYESLGLRKTEQIEQEDWGRVSTEMRYEVELRREVSA
jgi:GNAT superfamily N-acetyltransferase